MKKEFVCISCPVGCRLTVWDDEGEVKVSGNTCKRGQLYGVQEFTAPMRTVTSSVPVIHGQQAMCSVKTAQPVPKELDYDMWLGPAPYKPYNVHRTHQTFRGYWGAGRRFTFGTKIYF